VGGGGEGRSGISATEAVLADPCGGVRDAQGNTYIADQRHFRVLKVDAAGTLTVLAGVGAPRLRRKESTESGHGD
jgi:hypothetical protein